jgi:hypothetical protein
LVKSGLDKLSKGRNGVRALFYPAVAVTPKETVSRNYVPKLDFIDYYR